MAGIHDRAYDSPAPVPDVPPLCWKEPSGQVCDLSAYISPGYFERFLDTVLGKMPDKMRWWERPDHDSPVTVPDTGAPIMDPSPIPLPDSLGFLVGALAVLALVALWRHCHDLEHIR